MKTLLTTTILIILAACAAEQGESGDLGQEGRVGPAGPAGPQGVQGVAGSQGVQGSQGVTGPKGDTGAGTPGVDGENGPQGVQGVQGIRGLTGYTGPQGLQGPAGSDRMMFVSNTGDTLGTMVSPTMVYSEGSVFPAGYIVDAMPSMIFWTDVACSVGTPYIAAAYEMRVSNRLYWNPGTGSSAKMFEWAGTDMEDGVLIRSVQKAKGICTSYASPGEVMDFKIRLDVTPVATFPIEDTFPWTVVPESALP